MSIEIEGHLFGQRRPPLSHYIKRILREYPQGQVFKEIIQNADDAGATVVKFYLDCRNLSTLPHELVDRRVRKELDRFQGPALMAYNDAPFLEEDWEGIQNLQQSVKAENPHKVGSFGVGFNSVYHITDLPVIISGKHCGYLEPQEEIWKGEPGKKHYLTTLQTKCCKALLPYQEVEGFSPSSFSGTLFRFPLRRVASKLSNEIYTIDKIRVLFNVLKAEAKYLLLFLRAVCSIEIVEISNSSRCKSLFKVSVTSCDSTKHQKQLQTLAREVKVTFRRDALYKTKSIVSRETHFKLDIKDGAKNEKHEWLVVHRVGSEDDEVLELAKQQHVLPWVGAAYEISRSKGHDSGGRIYCFLPLPTEDRTPFSINVNGTFAVSSNRRSLIWESQERQGDNEGTWNKLLVERCLPHCYHQLIQELVKIPSISPDIVYKCWPALSTVQGTPWGGMLKPLYNLMLYSTHVVHTCANKGQWISLEQAVLIPQDKPHPDIVKSILISNGTKLVGLPSAQWNVISKCYSREVLMLSPSLVRNILKRNQQLYCELLHEEKLQILHYCLSDEEYFDLVGLELIPLANGKYETFNSDKHSLYVCTPKIRHVLLPRLHHNLIDVLDTNKACHSLLLKAAEKNAGQLAVLFPSNVAHLISQSNITEKWSQSELCRFWEWLQSYDLQIFCELPLVPVKNSSENTSIHKLTKHNSRVIYVRDLLLNVNLRSGLEKCGINFASKFEFTYLRHPNLTKFLKTFQAGYVLDSIYEPIVIKKITFSVKESIELMCFFNDSPQSITNRDSIAKLCAMSIFTVLQDKTKLYCLNDLKIRENQALAQEEMYNIKTDLIPNYPLIFKHGQPLLNKLSTQVYFLTEIDYLEKVAFIAISKEKFPKENLTEFMINVLDNMLSRYKYRQAQSSLVKVLRTLPFVTVNDTSNVRKHPSSLFDPNSEILLKLFHGEELFPTAEFKNYIQELRLCGLMDDESVTVDMLYKLICQLLSNRTEFLVEKKDTTTFAKVKALFTFLNRFPSKLYETVFPDMYSSPTVLSDAICQKAKMHAIFPVVTTKPSNYPSCLKWKGSSYNMYLSRFVSGKVIIVPIDHKSVCDPQIIGSEVFFVHDIPLPICQTLSRTSNPQILFSSVVNHFKHVIKNRDEIDEETLEKISLLTYKYLSSTALAGKISNLGCDDEWVWVESCLTFVSPTKCALSSNQTFKSSLEPFIYILPKKMKQYEQLLCNHGVHSKVTNNLVISVLKSIKSKSIKISALDAWSLVTNILTWASSLDDDVLNGCSLLIPIDSESDYPELYPVDQVSYTDDKMLLELADSSDEDYTLVHPSVAHLASKLGLQPLSDQLDITEDIFEDAGQHEPLTTRLSNILREYKDGLTIIKEMVQNADDAEATEVNILYDGREHDKEKLLFKGMADAHGPALVVHNNARFTSDDFENIIKLAGATKKDKPLKIGKFGVGFCSVYHITDVPSFISGEWLYIFDPTLSYMKGVIKNENQPGKRVKYKCKLISKTKQLSPYQNLFNFNPLTEYNETIFRFPFRNYASQISSKVYDKNTVNQLKVDLEENGKNMLLFLTHVKKIRFFSIRRGNQTPVEELTIEKMRCRENDRILTIKTTNKLSNASQEVHWFVSNVKEQQLNSGERKFQPAVSSVACQLLKSPSNEYEVVPVDGLVFCYLPLSVPSTGLPVHVSANFAVMSNRSGIWTSTQSGIPLNSREQWNQQLMMSVIPAAYCNLLKMLKDIQKDDMLTGYQFHVLLPLLGKLTTRYPWKVMIKTLLQKLLEEDLIYSRFSNEWVNLKQCWFLSESILSSNKKIPECVTDSLFIFKFPIVDVPQNYVNELNVMVSHGLRMFEEGLFCSNFFRHITKFKNHCEIRNNVLFQMFVTAASEIAAHEESELTSLLEDNPSIPSTPDGVKLKLASQLVDWQSDLKILFDETSEMLPITLFSKRQPVRKLMIDIGLLTTQLPWDMILKCAQSIQAVFEVDEKKALMQVQTLIKVINENIVNGDNPQLPLIVELKTTAFIPVALKPDDVHVLPWKGRNKKISSPCGMFHPTVSKYGRNVTIKKDCCLLGSQKLIINNLPLTESGCGVIPENVLELLDIETELTFTDVLANYECLMSAFNSTCNTTHTVQKFMKNDIEKTCRFTYEFFNMKLKMPVKPAIKTKLSSFNNKPFIWSGTSFICPENIALKWKENGPLLYEIPQLISERKQLVEILGICEKFSIEKLLETLKELHIQYESQELPTHYRDMIDAIINEFNNRSVGDHFECFTSVSETLVLPSISYELCLSHNLSYNDSPWLKDIDEGKYTLVHKTLNRDTALAMGVKPVRSKFLDKYHTSNIKFGGTPFGQRESLTQRIKNILRDYPLDATLLKELLQNADDAKATKMCVILDKRKNHGRERVLSKEWSELQGPALIVWNNEEFSEKDMEGIQELGLGSKRDDSETIGQFGIGFNVVYHLTDCPSFISGGKTLCIFDPHCKYVPGIDHRDPGCRYDNLDADFWNNMSDMKNAYLQGESIVNQPNNIFSGGTLFRFPLRCTRKHVLDSKIVDDLQSGLITSDNLETCLNEWIPQIKDALIFLNHITEFSYYVIDKNLICKAQYTVSMNEDSIERRKSFFDLSKQFKSHKRPKIFTYEIQIKCLEKRRFLNKEYNENWIVQQGIGKLENTTKSAQEWHFIDQVLPKHGIAAPIKQDWTFYGKLFCFLPLPADSGLPVHINGQFILNNNRRTLWVGQDDKKKWNDSLIDAIALSYVHFLINARKAIVGSSEYADRNRFYEQVDSYYRLFPFWMQEKHEQSRLSDSNCDRLAKMVFRNLSSMPDTKILAVEVFNKDSSTQKSSVTVEWNCLKNTANPFEQGYFLPPYKDKNERKQTIVLLKIIKMKLTCAPHILYEHLRFTDSEPALANRKSVFVFYRRFHERILPCCPCPIEESPFKKSETLKKFLSYLVTNIPKSTDVVFPESPFNCPLLLTADGQLRFFKSDRKVMRTIYYDLFPKSLMKFLHKDLLSMSFCSSYFVDEVPYSKIHELMEENYSKDLKLENCDNSNGCTINITNLKYLWKSMLNHGDEFLYRHSTDILYSWSLLPSKNGWLYSTRNEVIPIQPITSDDNKKIFDILVHTVHLPVVDLSYFNGEIIPQNIQQFIPSITDYNCILSMVYHLHCHQNVLDNISPDDDTCVSVLLDYFSRTTFLNDEDVKNQIISLPLFKTMSGFLTKLYNKQVYRWPNHTFCKAGYEKWACKGSTIFLEYFGTWTKLTKDFRNIGISLSETEIYLQLIFPTFSEFSPDERRQHLEYIKDKLYPQIKQDRELPTTSSLLADYYQNKKREASFFLNTLKALKCINCPQTDQLKAVCEFSDHTVDIYKYFPNSFTFLPTNYQNEEWLTFFRDLGLKITVTVCEFINFCKEVEKGQSQDLKTASEVLLKYLYTNGLNWNHHDLKTVASICFVSVSDLPQLSWIEAPCQAPNCIVKDNMVIAKFTQLQNAVTKRNANLIWTVKPVIKLPTNDSWELPILLQKHLNQLTKALNVTTKPSPEDVFQNLVNISNCDMSNPDLFFRYKSEYIVSENSKNKTNVIKIFEDSISCLQKTDMLPLLKDYSCIPVSVEHNACEDIPSKIVLVKPISVVAHLATPLDESLVPYINEVPNCLKPLMRSLELIGIAKTIQLPHICHLLKTLCDQIGEGTINPNQLRAVRSGIIKLAELLSSNQYTEENILKDLVPLYLPAKNGNQWFLKESNQLLFADGQRYSYEDTKHFKFDSTSWHLFQIPPKTSIDSTSTLISETSICHSLPHSIRPYPLYLYTTEKKMKAGIRLSENLFLASYLQKMLTLLNPIKGVFFKILSQMDSQVLGAERNVERLTSSLFTCILKHLKIEVIEELQAEVFIDAVEIGILSNPSFILEKQLDQSNHYILYLSNAVGAEECTWRELSQYMLMEVAVIMDKPSKDAFFGLIKLVTDCLQVHSESSLKKLAKDYNVLIHQDLSQQSLPERDDHDDDDDDDENEIIPKVGKKIPEAFQAMLDVSIDNIYKPQEWVGYEIKDNPSVIIWAVIIHPVETAIENKNHLKYYKVLTGEDNYEEVSALDLFKLMPKNIMKSKISKSKEIVIFVGNTETEYEWGNIKELKKAICEDLMKAWEISDERMREKAIKRLYLKYHPDKADPERREDYEEAFKFLKRQIDRLKDGLPLEDPNENDQAEPSASSWWSDTMFSKWKTEVPKWSNNFGGGSSFGYRQHDEGGSSGFSGATGSFNTGSFNTNWQTQVSPDEAKRWCRQAKADCEAMEVIKQSMNLTGSHVCQVILLAHETIEKSLKACMYALFGLNSSGLMTHNLISFAESICSERPEARSLSSIHRGSISLVHIAQTISPYYTKVRYPNEHPQFKAPVDIYSQRQAEEVAEFAELVIEFIKNIC